MKQLIIIIVLTLRKYLASYFENIAVLFNYRLLRKGIFMFI